MLCFNCLAMCTLWSGMHTHIFTHYAVCNLTNKRLFEVTDITPLKLCQVPEGVEQKSIKMKRNIKPWKYVFRPQWYFDEGQTFSSIQVAVRLQCPRKHLGDDLKRWHLNCLEGFSLQLQLCLWEMMRKLLKGLWLKQHE